jgi:O-antigen/teichoic acid export membrane protein
MFLKSVRLELLKHLQGGTLKARFASGAMWLLLGAGLSQLLLALSSIVIARVLGKEVFGEFGMVRSTVMMFGTVAGLGLGITTNKYIAEFRDSDPARAGRVLTLTTTLAAISGTLVAIVVALAADYLASETLGAPHLAGFVRLCAPLLAMSVVTGVQLGAVTGLEQFRVLSLLSTLTALTVASLAAVGAFAGGIEGAFYGTLIGSFVNVILMELILAVLRRRKGIRIAFAGLWRERQVLVSFAIPSLLAGLMVAPVTWAGLRLLFIRPDGAGEAALFQAANQLRMLALFVPGAIAQVVLPVLSNIQADVDASRYQRAIQAAAMACLVTGAAVAIPLMAASPQMMGLFGTSFSSGWLVLCLMCAAAVLQATNTVIGEALAALSKMWWGFWLNCLWGVEFLLAASLLVRHGAAGLAGAYVVSYLLHTIQVWALVTYVIRRRREWHSTHLDAHTVSAREWV